MYPNFAFYKSRGSFVAPSPLASSEGIAASKFHLVANLISFLNYTALSSKSHKESFVRVFGTDSYFDFLSTYSPHSLLPNNLLFYFDYYRNRFHPIFYDAGGWDLSSAEKHCKKSEAGASLARAINTSHGLILTSVERCMVESFYQKLEKWGGRGSEFTANLSVNLESLKLTNIPENKIAWLRSPDSSIFLCNTDDPGLILKGSVSSCRDLMRYQPNNSKSYRNLVTGKIKTTQGAVPFLGIEGWLDKEQHSIKLAPSDLQIIDCVEDQLCRLVLTGPSVINLGNKTEILDIKLSNYLSRAILFGSNISLRSVSLSGVKKKNDQTLDASIFTGCLTILDSKVKVQEIDIRSAHCEDAINFVGSDVEAENIKIVDSRSDALDSDFSFLRVNAVEIRSAGNDCLDFSWSTADISAARLVGCNDKGISVGENSRVTLINGHVSSAVIGLASKDGSTFLTKSLNVQTVTSCVDTYIKKGVFMAQGTIDGLITCE